MLLTVFLLYLIGSACAVRDVEYLAGRSGDIIIESTNVASGNSAILLHGQQFAGNGLQSIEDVRVADLLSHVMGAQPFNTLADREGFPKGDIFNKAKAALLVTLDSLSPELFAKYSTWADYQRVDITSQSFPSSTISLATTLATGATPSSHGIVAEQWKTNGEQVVAYGSPSATAFSTNMADLLSQEWSGQSLTVSASASTSLASAFSASQQFAGSRSFGYSLQRGVFESIYTQEESALTPSVNSVLESSSFSALLGTQFSDNHVKLTVGATQVTFDLSNQADFSLFAELSFVYHLFQVLEVDSDFSSLVADENPDFFALSFASLKAIEDTYGQDSASFSAAATMVANIVKYVVAQMDKLYGKRAVTLVACLAPAQAASPETKAAVWSRASAYMSQADFELYYPSLYVNDGRDANTLCSELKYAVETPSTSVHCFTSYNYFTGVYADNTTDNNSGNHTHKKPLNVPAFWIILWISIILVLFVLGGLYGLVSAGVEAASDSLLFRSTGRHLHQS